MAHTNSTITQFDGNLLHEHVATHYAVILDNEVLTIVSTVEAANSFASHLTGATVELYPVYVGL